MSKRKPVQAHIETHEDGTTTVIFDGKDVSQKAESLWIEIGTITKIYITYACYEQLTLDGPVEVVHVCPKKAR